MKKIIDEKIIGINNSILRQIEESIEYINCEFKDFIFPENKLTIFRNCTFQNITFNNISESSFVFSKFYDCNFKHCELKIIDFGHSEFYQNNTFESIKILNCNFRKSKFKNSENILTRVC